VLLPAETGFSAATAAEVAEALNVKRLDPVTDLEGLLEYSVVPNFRVLGPKAGKRAPLVKDALAAVDGATVRHALEQAGGYDLALGDGSRFHLAPEDVDVRAASHEELALAQEGGLAVAIDTTVDDDMRAEGTARDVIRVINDERKAAGLQISDRIKVRIGAGGRLGAAIHRHRDWIAREVLAVEFALDGAGPERASTTTVDGQPLTLEIEIAD
jgi:isoleucyl-tRNA synthetase